MRLLDLIHRWTGGVIGLLLALMGLSGAVLVHKDAWVSLPGAEAAQQQSTAAIVAQVEQLMADPADRPQSILFATSDFGLSRLTYPEGAGGYADQAGRIVTRWDGKWDRPEVWLFDFHHHLFSGDTGEIVAGIAGLAGLGFVITGVILWWRTRRTFKLRPWPKRMSRPAILMHHRDLGVVAAPLLLISLVTGTMLALEPVRNALLSPLSSPAEMKMALLPPEVEGAPLAADLDWAGMIREARRLYPDAEIRILSLPRQPGGLISLRTRQPAEWLPNGRTTLYFAPDSGRLIEARDAFALPLGWRVFNYAYPLHAAKVGGLPYRLVMTLSGLALAMLGSFAVWSFWFRRPRSRARAPARVVAAE
ncbi:PepSY domain-containing protein [Sphingomonas gilva]|uniref:PepSY domain-containing protein n=1 Tax=Sphingomonas gilva TaxID=2305907 RepID=A0A396RPZ7_9SPHN|nr:PepSY-associated TM helix domain-containing protein [Sphingomonas gilva]RHW17362.1 PepSY domain-containing protein [Sphingomonas gilva]